MPMPEGYVKAKLAIEGGETIQALFNPTEFTITKGNNWTFDPIKGTSLPKGKFGGGKPREMPVNLLLDQSLPNGGQVGQGDHRQAVQDDGGAVRRRRRRRRRVRARRSSRSSGAR